MGVFQFLAAVVYSYPQSIEEAMHGHGYAAAGL